MTQQQIFQAALAMSTEDRAALVRALDLTLEHDPNDWEQAWNAEAERRDRELENGTVQEVPYTEAISRIRAKLK